MMIAVINFEYFISPLICSMGNVDEHIDGMILLRKLISNENIDIKAEERILDKMNDAGFYPCTKILGQSFSKGDDCVHSAQDVARLINNIISDLIQYSCEILTHEIEWDDFVIKPEINAVSEARKEYIIHFLKGVLAASKLTGQNTAIFYAQRDSKLCSSFTLELNGVISGIYPEELLELPARLQASINSYGRLADYIVNMDSYFLYRHAEDMRSLKLALYCGCVHFLHVNKSSYEIRWDDFEIGDDFYLSLLRNYCSCEQQFSSVAFETIVQVLCRQPKNEVNPFRKSEKSTEQRVYGNLKAYRTHITNKHQALRLMFWVDLDKTIILANVGPKFECEISKP